jgi:arylsulfatase A-like enzyme
MLRRRLALLGALWALSLTLTAVFLSRPRGEGASGRWSVVWVVWDTVRADRMSVYGHARPTTPNLQARAGEFRLYERAISPSFWTLPSHASLFTGLPARSHGATKREDPWLEGRFPTVAEWLGGQGYATFAWTTNPYVYVSTNVLQGFDVVLDPLAHPGWREQALADTRRCLHPEDRSTPVSLGRPRPAPLTPKSSAGASTRALLGWLDEVGDEAPTFAFLNWMEAHTPRLPCPEHREAILGAEPELARLALATPADSARLREVMFKRSTLTEAEIEAVRAVYDATLHELDTRFEALLQGLEARGRLDRTVVILTSDHGEHLGEHGLYNHNFSVYDPLVHVPLLIRAPGLSPGRVSEAVSTRQLPNTLAELLGLPPLAPGLPASLLSASGPAVSELVEPHSPARGRPKWNRPTVALVEEPYKLWRAADGETRLFDRRQDPAELVDQPAPEVRARLLGALEAWEAEAPPFQPQELGPRPSRDAVVEELRALGYVDP